MRRWLRPPRRLRPTRAGWIFFALIAGVGFAALNTGNNLLYLVLSLMLAFLVLSGLLSEAALRGIAVRRVLPRELGAERDAWVTLEIRNLQSGVAAYAITVEDRLWIGGTEQPAGRCFALRIEGGGRIERSYRLRPERRGELAFAGFVVFTRFPFGLFSKSLVIEAPETALVFPALDPVEALPERTPQRDPGDRSSASAGPGASVGGIREFVPGDPPRRIDWRSSLRSGGLWVREVESEADGEVWVRLHTAGRAPGEAFERDVRHTASLAAACLERGMRVGLRIEALRLDAEAGVSQRLRVLSALARVDPREAA